MKMDKGEPKRTRTPKESKAKPEGAATKEDRERKRLAKALDKYGDIIEALTDFRKTVSELGYKGITKDMVLIVCECGNSTDKAALCSHAFFDMIKYGEKPLLTSEKVDEIAKSVDNMEEYVRGVLSYDILSKAKIPLFWYKNALGRCLSNVAVNLLIHDHITKTEEMFSRVSSLIDETKRGEFESMIEGYKDYLMENVAFAEEEKTKYREDIINNQKKDRISIANTLANKYYPNRVANYKGVLDGIKEWIDTHRAEMFVPVYLLIEFCEYRLNFIHDDLAYKFYTSIITEREENGEEVTEQEREVAVIPDGETIEPSKQAKQFIIEYLNEQEKLFETRKGGK